MKELHRLLRRQVERHVGSPEALSQSARALLDAVDRAYLDFEADRTLLEHSLELSSQELLQVNSEMRAVLEALPDALMVLDTEGRVTTFKGGPADEGWVRPEQALGKSLEEVLPRDAHSGVFDDVARARAEQRRTSLEYTARVGGQETAWELRVVPLLDRQAMVLVRNISALRAAWGGFLGRIAGITMKMSGGLVMAWLIYRSLR